MSNSRRITTRKALHAPNAFQEVWVNLRDHGEDIHDPIEDIPIRIKEIVRTLDEIENSLRPKGESKLHRAYLPEAVGNILIRLDALGSLTRDVEKQLSRTTDSEIPEKALAVHAKKIVDALEEVEEHARPPRSGKLRLEDISPRVESIDKEATRYYNLISRVSKLVDPKSTLGSLDGVPSKVKELRDEVSRLGAQRQKARERIKTLAQENHELLEQKKEFKLKSNERKPSLDDYLDDEEEEGYHSILTTDLQDEDQGLRTIERNLGESHARTLEQLVRQNSEIQEMERAQAQEIEKIKDEGEKELKRLRERHAIMFSNIEDQKRELEEEKAIVVREKVKLEEEVQKLRQKVAFEENLSHQLQELGTKHKLELKEQHENFLKVVELRDGEWKQDLNEAKKQHELSREKAREDLAEYEAHLHRLDQDQVQLKEQLSRKLDEQQQLHTKALEMSNSSWLQQIKTMKEEHKTELEKDRQSTAEDIRKREEARKTKENEWEQSLKKERLENIARLNDKDREHKIAIETLQKQWKKLVETERRDKDKLQDLLLKQDVYTGLTDQEILEGVAAQEGKIPIIGFRTLVSKITSFSDWEWREDRRVWPAEFMTSSAGAKQRRLKKLILGDAIWTTLFRLLLCSPFIILGEEGTKRQRDWIRHFESDEEHVSEGYRWPKPTGVSEKFRYETCQAALDALTKPSSPDGPLRSSFIKNRDPFHEEFLGAMEAYVDLTERREQELLKFLTEAVRMWLVFCTQRYRIRITLPGSSESDPTKKVMLAKKDDDLKFTVAPRLQRHGNPQGAQLQNVTVISGYDGKVETISDTL